MRGLPPERRLPELEHSRRVDAFTESLTPVEKVAYVVGGHVARGFDFPTDEQLAELRRSLGDERCRRCNGPLPPRPQGRGRPPTRCDRCRNRLELVTE